MENIVDSKLISDNIKNEIRQNIKFEMIKPSLAYIGICSSKESEVYARELQKVCNEVGIYFRNNSFDEDVSELTVINKIKELNNDEYVNGIVVKLPLPNCFNEKRIVNTIINSKDVDGLTDINAGRLISGRKTLVPSTSMAVMEILKHYNVDLQGKNVVLIGRGKLTCKPLIQLFLNEDATVTICHSKTGNLKDMTINADIIVSATGVKNLITEDMVKDGVIIIDVGMNYDNDKVSGDVDFKNVSKKAALINTNPNGVGPIAIAFLMKNVAYCYLNKKK